MSLFAIKGIPTEDSRGDYWGTGTLVLADGPCILTAAHVLEKLDVVREGSTKGNDFFGISWRTERKGRALHFVGAHSWRKPDSGWGEWGPDVALIRLSNVDALDIRDRDKHFYDLDKHAHGSAANDASSSWTVIGAPGEQVTISETESEMLMPTGVFGSMDVKGFERDGLDYVQIPTKHDARDGRPESYGGISGSGLWRLNPTTLTSGAVARDEDLTLRGVAFWQHYNTVSKNGFLRSHGRKTIDKTRALELSKDSRLLLAKLL